MFTYYNVNPNGDIIGDCVIRAIAYGLDIDYESVIKLLYRNSEYYNCDMIVRNCYAKVLDDVFHLESFYGDGRAVGEIVEDFKDHILIIRIKNHLTASEYGNIIDIWDTSNEIVDIFWVVK